MMDKISTFKEYIKNLLHPPQASIKFNTIMAVILIVLLPMGASYFYFYKSTFSMLKEDADLLLHNTVHMINDDLRWQLDIIDETSMRILSNSTIRTLLDTDCSTDEFLRAQKKLLMDRELKGLLLFNYAWDKKLIRSVFIYESDRDFYFISRNSIIRDYLNSNMDIEKVSSPLSIEKHFIPPSESDQTIYFIRKINDIETQRQLGILSIGIDINSLASIESGDVRYKNIQVITFDNTGTIFSHTDKGKLGKIVNDNLFLLNNTSKIHEVKLDGEIFLAAVNKLSDYGLNSVVAIPKHEVFKELNSDKKRYLATIFVSIIFSLLLGLNLSKRLIEPLKLITDISNKVKDGNYREKLPPSNYLELNNLNFAFNTMINEIDYLINKVYEEQLLLKESELAVLQSQINPHFLFNVLETIGWEALYSKNDKIHTMILSLSQLLRASIALNINEKIPIGEELAYIENYLALQKFRFEDRLSYEINIGEKGIKHCLLPKLCLLPMVENAVIHGLEKKRDKGHLKVDVNRLQGNIVISVEDNGVGFNTKELNFENIEDVELREKPHHSIGLYNTNKRIKLTYGEDYGLSVQSIIGKGTKVTLLIPENGGNHIV